LIVEVLEQLILSLLTRALTRKVEQQKKKKKGLSYISYRQRRKEGTFRASGLAGIESTPARSVRAGYARLNLSATAAQSMSLAVAMDIENGGCGSRDISYQG
jgi:hypothetical protein